MSEKTMLLCTIMLISGVVGKEIRAEEDISVAIRSLREQVNALLDHRQQDYNALEESLKRAIEKNTELFVLKNEVKQLRKEVNSVWGGSGNEAKNERLRVRWLGSAVTELQGEVAEVLRARNASEELAERSRMKGELALLKGDVASVGRGIRNVGGRISKIEAVLGTIRVDIAAVKERFGQLSQTCADIASQLSAVQAEVKSLRCEASGAVLLGNSQVERRRKEKREQQGATANEEMEHNGVFRHRLSSRRHGYSRWSESRVEERLKSLERKISLMTQRRALLEERLALENQEWPNLSKRVKNLEKIEAELSRRISNVTKIANSSTISGEEEVRLVSWMETIEEAVASNNSSTRQELARLGLNAARKAADLSLTREELSNLRRTVQALSVSASKLQERSDRQEETIDRLRLSSSSSRVTWSSGLEASEDKYHSMADNLPHTCDQQSGKQARGAGLQLLKTAKGIPTLVFCRDGWIVIGRRIDGTLDFDRSWAEYALGFGSPVAEYWIGNENLHQLTRDNCTKLRIDLVDIYGERWRAEYQEFAVSSEESGYQLRVNGYAGNATDAFSYQNGMAFSAKDRDMDLSSSHCAANYHGGWWFSRCQHANLNGKYSLGLTWFRTDSNQWLSIASSEMSVRREPSCRTR